MSRERSDQRPRRRRLTEDEHELWSGITRSVAPLKRKPAAAPRAAAPPDHAAQPSHPRTEEKAARHRVGKSVAKPASTPAQPMTALDRRQKRRLARGVEPIERRIDLHGKTQSEAHAALLAFLHHAQAEGARFVLVITGKGGLSAAGSPGRGVLKRQVPLWLRQAEFRAYVLAAEDAHRTHGGEGALYIRLRRSSGPPSR